MFISKNRSDVLRFAANVLEWYIRAFAALTGRYIYRRSCIVLALARGCAKSVRDRRTAVADTRQTPPRRIPSCLLLKCYISRILNIRLQFKFELIDPQPVI